MRFDVERRREPKADGFHWRKSGPRRSLTLTEGDQVAMRCDFQRPHLKAANWNCRPGPDVQPRRLSRSALWQTLAEEYDLSPDAALLRGAMKAQVPSATNLGFGLRATGFVMSRAILLNGIHTRSWTRSRTLLTKKALMADILIGDSTNGSRNSETPESLQRLAQAVVDASKTEYLKILATRLELDSRLDEALQRVSPVRIGTECDHLFEAFREEVENKRTRLAQLIERQSRCLNTFNIALFGRTGAGKSSLITALTRGDGTSISQGESDWTTEVAGRSWGSCRVIDTPGINGWGRTQSRESLERVAQEAVETADFVLLCFDSQSQQAQEFMKVADWVQRYRKPVIAVLNQRNAVWRMPDRVGTGSARARVSRAMREHAGNIRDGLAAIGLVDVPVVGLSAKHAVAARAQEPYEGPDPESLVSQRLKYGRAELERRSNYPVLSELLECAVDRHAADFRVDAMHDQMRGVLVALRASVDKVAVEAKQGAKTVESQGLEPMLTLLGYPARDNAADRAAVLLDGVDLLDQLEKARGGEFQAPLEGEYTRQLGHELDAALETLRMKSLQEADACIEEAFTLGNALSAEDVRARCFNAEAMQAVADQALTRAWKLLMARMRLTERGVALSLRLKGEGLKIEGDAGSGWRIGSWGLKVGGVLSGVAATLAGVAAINVWNPLGLGAGLAAGVVFAAGLVSTALGWAGKSASQRAEASRLEQMHAARKELGTNVHATFDALREAVLKSGEQARLEVCAQALPAQLRAAHALHALQASACTLSSELGEIITNLRPPGEPQTATGAVANELSRRAFPGQSDAADLHWLGQDWVDDPHGLHEVSGSTQSGRTTAYDPSLVTEFLERLRLRFRREPGEVTFGEALAWLDGARATCAGDAAGLAVVDEVDARHRTTPPRVHLVGDYNAGKTSFIKRLLVDDGQAVGEPLEVAARPTTDCIVEHAYRDVLLVDTPGFQSSNADHAATALAAIPDAAAVLLMFQPNLLIGNDDALRACLLDDGEAGRVSKRARSFLVVNRSDELGVDPELDTQRYLQLGQRKRAELVRALDSRGVEVASDRIFVMASDPYGLVGDRRDVDASAFDRFRHWDGFADFSRVLRESRRYLRGPGRARALLEGARFRFKQLANAERKALEARKEQVDALQRFGRAATDEIAKGTLLGDGAVQRLHRLLSAYVRRLEQDLLAEQDPDALHALAKKLEHWWNNPALEPDLRHWHDTFVREIEAWRTQAQDAIDRRLSSVEFQHAFGKGSDSQERFGNGPAPRAGSPMKKIVSDTGRTLGSTTRDVVYEIGKFFGVKFKPWGAVNAAKTLGKVGVVFSALGVALDIGEIIADTRRSNNREAFRSKLHDDLGKSAQAVARSILDGSPEAPGLRRRLEEDLEELKSLSERLVEEQTRLDDDNVADEGRLQVYERLAADALALLDRKDST